MRWTGPVIATIDFLMSFAVCAVAMINPPQEPQMDATDKSVCVMAIDIKWDQDRDWDVDLWMEGPDEKKPVGWGSYKTGVWMDLVRDDIGWPNNTNDGTNQERICVKLIRDGEYIVNLNMYSYHKTKVEDVHVTTTVSLVDPYSAFMKEIFSSEEVLVQDDEEITVIRFTMKDGALVEGSERHLYKHLVPADRNASAGPSGGARRDQ